MKKHNHIRFSGIYTGYLVICCFMFLFSGCKSNDPINMNELLQLTQSGKVYTAYNIWYEDPMKISSLNYLSGKILPFGSEVKDIVAVDDVVTFTDVASGKKYKIEFCKKLQLIPFEKYLKRLFTTDYPSSAATGIPDSLYRKIQGGIVEKGMTKKEVLAAYGYPSAHRTPYIKGDTWVFFIKPMHSKRVVFRQKKVIAIIKL